MSANLEQTTAHGRHAAAYVAGVAVSARPAVRSNLRRAAAIAAGHAADWNRYPWHRLEAASLEAMRNGLADRFAPATANATIASVRAVLKRAWIAGDLDRADYERRLAALPAVKGRSAAGRSLAGAQVGRLFATAADQSPATAARDAALLACLYGLGLRRAEAAAATVADLDLEAGELLVHGKGRRERRLPVTNGSRQALADWLAVRGDEPGPLFRAVNKGGRVQDGGMTGRAIAKRVAALATRAGLGSLSPHALRRSFATQLLRQGNDVLAVQRLMGHASTNTTSRYDRRGDDAARTAAATLAVPYQGRA